MPGWDEYPHAGHPNGDPYEMPTDLAALQDMVLRVAALAEDNPEVRSLALDPILASPDGVFVANARLVLGPPPTRPDTGPRRLRPIPPVD